MLGKHFFIVNKFPNGAAPMILSSLLLLFSTAVAAFNSNWFAWRRKRGLFISPTDQPRTTSPHEYVTIFQKKSKKKYQNIPSRVQLYVCVCAVFLKIALWLGPIGMRLRIYTKMCTKCYTKCVRERATARYDRQSRGYANKKRNSRFYIYSRYYVRECGTTHCVYCVYYNILLCAVHPRAFGFSSCYIFLCLKFCP